MSVRGTKRKSRSMISYGAVYKPSLTPDSGPSLVLGARRGADPRPQRPGKLHWAAVPAAVGLDRTPRRRGGTTKAGDSDSASRCTMRHRGTHDKHDNLTPFPLVRARMGIWEELLTPPASALRRRLSPCPCTSPGDVGEVRQDGLLFGLFCRSRPVARFSTRERRRPLSRPGNPCSRAHSNG
jgi:hypothetical protein